MFYPVDARRLAAELDDLLGAAAEPSPRLGYPKALVVPHAGYIYSGPVAARACDLAMPDLMKIGGITGWLRAMALAEAASLPLSSHLFIEASAHALAVSPTCHFLEYLDMAGAILAEPVRPVGGMVTAHGPGLGMAWNEDAVARFVVD